MWRSHWFAAERCPSHSIAWRWIRSASTAPTSCFTWLASTAWCRPPSTPSMSRSPNVSNPAKEGAARPEPPKPSATAFQSVVLVLQGGGALGAYQAGVYEALAERGIEPTWLSGIPIGAINSAIIAGNPPAERVAKLRSFWELVSAGNTLWPGLWTEIWSGDAARGVANQFAAGGVAVN